MTNASFSLQKYIFDKVNIDLEHLQAGSQLALNIDPSGIYYPETGVFNLTFTFEAFQETHRIVSVRCVADYKFQKPIPFDGFPRMFYANSIAILFPYVRAFVNTVTLQANLFPPIIIPTLNLTSLEEKLMAQTKVK